MQNISIDEDLLERFTALVWDDVPHLIDGRVANPTPMLDVTKEILECARTEYGLRLPEGVVVYAKMDSKIKGGSVKVRPAAAILRNAIANGLVRSGDTIFEATSGNFGLALGSVQNLDLHVVALVSRRLQQGVTERLRAGGVKLVNLDIDVCPAPGLKGDEDLLVAKGVASNVRQQLAELGFEPAQFDRVRGEAEALLARQDAIGLAKLLAKAYGGFCTEQYDNDINVEVHRTVTGPELDQQLKVMGASLGDLDFVCTFGTGGTGNGVARYVSEIYGKKGVRVVFPLAGQDVAGIRTKDKAIGLKFYNPESFAGEHEADFEEASKVFEFFNRNGYDVGESGALALYAVMQLVNYGMGRKFVVMVADDSSKYLAEVSAMAKRGKRDQARLDEAAANIGDYAGVIWAHNMFVPREEGIKLLASSLGIDRAEIKVAGVRDVQAVLNGREPSREFEELLPKNDRPVLVVCMAGNTSLMMARVLERRGIAAESLVGGITGLPASIGRQPLELVQVARS